MKPYLLSLLLSAGMIFGQAPEAAPPAGEAPKVEEAQAPKPEEAAQEAKAESAEEAAPAVERPFSYEVEAGVRWNNGVKGDENTYRSIVNQGEGPRLLNWDMRYNSDAWKGVQKAHFRGSGWGGDPTAWLQAGVESMNLYRFTVDHRSTAYFSTLPSFGNPLLGQGILFSQRSFDMQRNLTDLNLEILPANRIVPYFGYMHDRGFGRGVSPFVSDSNEYPVLTRLSDRTNLIRGGVRMQFNRAHLTLEQGGILFRDDQDLSTADRNLGNRTTPIFGQTLVLNQLLQAYEVEGSSVYSKGFFTAQPTNWADVSAAFQFSQPRNDTTYRQLNEGRFIDLDSLLFSNSQSIRLLGAAQQPHVTANLGVELRPVSRVRILQSWMTDRLHNASGIVDTAFVDRLEWRYSQVQTEALVDVSRRLSVRGGYRYVWGDGLARASLVQPPNVTLEKGELKRGSVLAGVAYRMTDRFSLNADTEIARSEKVLFRTSLSDYEKVRLRGRYQLRDDFQLYGTFQYLQNTNPPELNRFEFDSRQTSLGFQWLPKQGQTVQFLGEYSRSAIRSDLFFYTPQFLLQLDRSLYTDNAHTITGLVTWNIPGGWTWHPQLSFGGSAFVSSGSRPTEYYQPVARLRAPVAPHVDLVAEYRFYQVSQAFYAFEGFRNHQGIVGIRIH